MVLHPDEDVNLKNWPTAATPKAEIFSDIKTKPTIDVDDLITLYRNRVSARSDLKNDSLALLLDKLEKMFASESASITEATHKTMYVSYFVPSLRNWIGISFKNELNSAHATGIAATRCLLDSCHKTSALFKLIDEIKSSTQRSSDIIDLTDDFIPTTTKDTPIDKSSMKSVYIPSVLEAPIMGNIPSKGFNPPKYRTGGNFLNFVEQVANPYFTGLNLDYKTRAAALWLTFPTTTLKNNFATKFKPFLDSNMVQNYNDFLKFYLKVSKELFPQQQKTAFDHEIELDQPNFKTQRGHETVEDFLYRIVNKFKLAFPLNYDDPSRRLKICRTFYSGLRDPNMKKHLRDEHYNLLFEQGCYNTVLDKIKIRESQVENLRRLGSLEVSENVNYVNQKDDRPRAKSNSSKPPQVRGDQSDLSREISFLARGKNVDRKTNRLIIPMERIPASIRNRRDFDARNYVDSKTYRNIVSMAKMNIHDRKTKLNQVNEIASTHDHHKPGEDDNYRNNVEIEPCRSYQNVILSNSVINSVNESTAPTASAPTVRST